MAAIGANRISTLPVLLSSDKTEYFLQTSPQGVSLFAAKNPAALYQLQEPVLLAQGTVTHTQQVHLVILKANGELCYNLVSPSGTQQTAILAKLDVRSARYRRLLLFPLGKTVHIFYAYAHRAIPDLWHIEHRFWNGKSWLSVHVGEVVQTRDPLYTVNLDAQGNLHLLMLTFHGQRSLLLSNRFNTTFTLWGNPVETLSIPREVIDMASLMTPANIHHLFWITRTSGGQYELSWAQRTQAQELSNAWQQAPAPLKSFRGAYRGLGLVEIHGSLWLLADAAETSLLLYQGEGWKTILSKAGKQRPLQYMRTTDTGFYSTYWLEEEGMPRTPAFYKQLGITVKVPSPPHTFSLSQSVPAPQPQPAQEISVPQPQPAQEISAPLPQPAQEISVPQLQPAQEISAPLPQPAQEISAPQLQPTQSVPAPQPQQTQNILVPELPSAPEDFPSLHATPQAAAERNLDSSHESVATGSLEFNPEFATNQFYALVPMITETLDPILKTVSDLEHQNRHLSAILESVLSRHTQTESSLQKLEQQFSELQREQETNEKGFWGKWFR